MSGGAIAPMKPVPLKYMVEYIFGYFVWVEVGLESSNRLSFSSTSSHKGSCHRQQSKGNDWQRVTINIYISKFIVGVHSQHSSMFFI